ncbi:MAG TPA: serine hydrolase [Terriglobales bacterium]|nr:serine hydrolase [Terriglobales bacterium]
MPRSLGPDDVLRLTAPAEPQLSPDGRLVAFTRLAPDRERDQDVGHVWVVAAGGGEAVRWTAGERGDGAPRWSPDGRRLAFLSARGESAARQLWVIDAGGGEARRLTDLPGGLLAIAWSPDGDRIACVAIVRPAAEGEAERAQPVVVDRLGFKVDGLGVLAGARAHLFVVPVDGGTPRQLTFGDSWVGGPAWSPDGGLIAYVDATHSERDLDRASHVFVVPAEGGGVPRRVTGGPGVALCPDWTPDGGRLVFIGRPRADHLMNSLYVVDAAGGEAAPLLDGFDRTVMAGAVGYPGGPPEVGADGRVTFCARIGGCVHLFRVGVDDRTVEPLVGGDDRVVSGFSTAGEAVAFVAADAHQPGDVFLRGAGGGERRLTELNHELLAEAPPVRAERRTFTAADGVRFEAFVYRPHGGGPAPLLLDVHGGPHNAFAPALSSGHLYRQELVARGWCVVAPNPRGSDGYGLRFLQGVLGGWGRFDQQDFEAAVDGLVAEGLADPERLAVTGYSYGGFTTSWLIGQTRRFRAAVAGGVVTNLGSMYGGSDAGSTIALHELGVEPFQSWAPFDDLSPVRHAASIETPLLILHGEADDRCPIGQAEDLFAILRRQRREVRLVRYPGASHLFIATGRLSHRLDYQRRLVDWVTDHAGERARPRAATAGAAELRERLAAAAERIGVPGAAAGVLLDGREEYAYHGVTSVENPLPVDATTLFQVGSTTKTFTATALLRLVEQGRVELSAPVRRYVPELRLRDEDAAERVTVLQLLNHTAGWAGDHFLDTGDGDDALARYVESMAELDQVSRPGTIASYNNAALSLAGRVVERVTGLPYETALRELVLDPLGMEQSSLVPADVMSRRFAAGHTQVDGTVRVARPWRLPRAANAAGGLASSAADQLRYARFHLGEGEGLLRRDTLELMRRPTASLGGGALGDEVGISWLLRMAGGERLAGHGGSTNGQQSAFVMVPGRGFAITVLTNSDRGAQLHRELVRWALDAYAGVVERDPEPLALSPAELAAYAGEYGTDIGLLTLAVDGGDLVARVRYAPAALARLRVVFEVPREELPPMPLRVLPGDGYVVADGESKGTRGRFVRRDGLVVGIYFGGRVALRRDGG